MKNNVLIFVLFASIMIGCKDKKNPKVDSENHFFTEAVVDIDKSENFGIDMPIKERHESQIVSVTKDSLLLKAEMKSNNKVIIADNQIVRWSFPVIKPENPDYAENINKRIEEMVVSFTDKKFTKLSDQKEYLVKENQRQLNASASDKDYLDVNNEKYFSDYKVDVVYNTVFFLGLKASYSTWYGGASNFGSTNVLFDCNTGKEVTFDDCFIPEAKPFIISLIKKQLRVKFHAEYNELKNVSIDRQFNLYDKGIVFNYNKYEITYGAIGAPQVKIPYDRINNYIKPDGPLAVFQK